MKYDDLIEYYGSQSAIAKAIGLTQPSVWEWQETGVPEQRQLEFQRLTHGQLRADPRIIKKYSMLLSVPKASA